MRYSLKLLFEICELLFQIRDFSLKGCDIAFQPGYLLPHRGPTDNDWLRLHLMLPGFQLPAEQVGVARFLHAGLAGKKFYERRLAFHQALQRGLHDAQVVKAVHAFRSSAKRRESPDGVELTFATNVLGYHLLTGELLECLCRAPAARVINTASMMAYGLQLDDVNFERRRYDASAAYAQSKQADRMLTWALARRLAGTSVTANAFHPGAVNTALLRALAPGLSGTTAAEGADTAIWLATSREVAGVSGRLWVRRRETHCKFRGHDNEEALWSLCDQMTAS